MFIEGLQGLRLRLFFRKHRYDIPGTDTDGAARDDEIPSGTPDGDEDKVPNIEFTDLVIDYWRPLLGYYLKDGAARDRGYLLEVRALCPVV